MTQSDVHAPSREEATVQLPTVESEAPRPRRRTSTKRRVLAGAVVLVLVGGGLGAYFGTRSSSPTTVTTRKVTVGYGTIEQTASATGTISAADTDDLDFAVSGRVNAVDVSVGQNVAAGQALASVNTDALSAQVDEAQASLDSAEAKLSSDQSNSSTSSAQITADESSVTAAQSSLSNAQSSLSEATLTSPIAGVVAEVNLATGQDVSGSGSGGSSPSGSSSSGDGASGSGSSFAGSGSAGSSSSDSSSSSSSSSAQVVVIGKGSYVVDATVDDTQVGELAVGDQATITPEGSETPVYGQVSSIGLLASSSSGVASFPVVINVTGSPSGLYAGASANVSIITKEIQNALEVPTTAVQFSNGNSTVTVVDGGKQTTQVVSLGTSSGGYTQVLSGLTAGETVLERIVSISGGTTGRTGGFPGGGGFGGGGFGGGGFGGGGFGGGGFGGGGFGGAF